MTDKVTPLQTIVKTLDSLNIASMIVHATVSKMIIAAPKFILFLFRGEVVLAIILTLKYIHHSVILLVHFFFLNKPKHHFYNDP